MTQRMMREKLTALAVILTISTIGAGCSQSDSPPEAHRVFEEYAREELLPTFDPEENPDVDSSPVNPQEERPVLEVTPVENEEPTTPEPQPVPTPETAATPEPSVSEPPITPPVPAPEAPTIPGPQQPVATPTPIPPSERPPLVTPRPNNSVSKSDVHRFQVLVFPHDKKYATPQGREAVRNRVVINAIGTCSKFETKLDENQEWIKFGGVLETNDRFIIEASDVISPYFYECTDGFVVKRDGLESFKYSGNYVAIAKKGTVRIVNLVDPEMYLKGVVPSEVYSYWPMEVLKAQAVAARTYAWWSVINARKRGLDYYDMDDTVAYQAYTGLSKTRAATDQSVDKTSGMVIRSSDGDIIKAYFSADSGGHTADSLDVFNESRSYCKAKPELFDVSKLKVWPKTIQLSEITKMLRGSIPAGVAVISLEVRTKDRSGRVTSLLATLSNGKKLAIGGVSFSSAQKLMSRFYEIIPADGMVLLKGKGFGHGVGMSQEGANQYVAQMNWTFEQILQFYYTGVTLSE